MILAIDCGNTNITFALYSLSGENRGTGEWKPVPARPADDYAVALSQLLNQTDLPFPS